MLIKALCDYYDKVMIPSGEAVPKGYSKIQITHTMCLNPDGTIDNIIDNKDASRTTIMPKRRGKNCPNSEIIEHRSKHIFGLELKNGEFF